MESLAEIEKKYKKCTSEEAENSWLAQYAASLRVCSHAYWRGACRNTADCEVQYNHLSIVVPCVSYTCTKKEPMAASENVVNIAKL